MKQLIVAADDFGLTNGVSAGIIEAIAHGVVSSTSAMVAWPDAADRLARHHTSELSGRVGLHLQLTTGVSCAPPAAVPSLVDAEGHFARRRAAEPRRESAEIAHEWRAQADRLRAIGITPAHLDSHHHIHHQPEAVEPFAALAASLGVPGRGGPPPVRAALAAAGVAHAEWLETSWFGGVLTVDRLVKVVTRAFAVIGNAGTVELMCHPGLSDRELEAVSSYTTERERELAVFCAPDLPGRLRDLGITIVPAGAIGQART